jgi:predicted glutamine amidotransferase
MGPPITLDLLTTIPQYSVVRQSFKARMREEPLNGDGFGLAWYVPDISPMPALFRSIQPAWNNINLLHLSRVSVSPVILAHVRAATTGFSVSEANCHPFIAEEYAFMHNGAVAEFKRIKRTLRAALSDEAYHWIHGSTDSEHLFAVFRDRIRLRRADSSASPEVALADALEDAILEIKRLTESVGAARPSTLNLAVTDGRCAAVSRYATSGDTSPSLYVRTGNGYVCRDGVCQMIDSEPGEPTALVASEPLTEERGWQVVPQNHLVMVDERRNIRMRPIDRPRADVSHN